MPLMLVAEPPNGERAQWALEGAPVTVGRAHAQAPAEMLQSPGDERLSRAHFVLEPQGSGARVRRLQQARNPLVFEGREQDDFNLSVGQFFFAGRTRFYLLSTQSPLERTLIGQVRERARQRRAEVCFTALTELLQRLRQGQEDPGTQALGLLGSLLPRATRSAFLEKVGSSWLLRAQHPPGPEVSLQDEQLLEELASARETSVFHLDSEQPAGGETLRMSRRWQIVSPLSLAEASSYALWLQGEGSLVDEEAEDAAALVDLVSEVLGHHLAVQQAAEYGGMLAVFGHHVGTLFKGSGALELFATSAEPQVRRVLERLMPIWGVSQAISLHKKQAESQWEGTIANWVVPGRPTAEALRTALRHLVGYVHAGGSGPPFLPWVFEGQPLLEADSNLVSLPPLQDQPLLFDRTLAFCVGLLEMLSNVRNYPEARGAGREDRRELSEIPAEQREVSIGVELKDGWLRLIVEQPVVTRGDGSLPVSGSLQRIRGLESRLLHGVVETGPLEAAGSTDSPWVVRARQVWTYHWGRLCR